MQMSCLSVLFSRRVIVCLCCIYCYLTFGNGMDKLDDSLSFDGRPDSGSISSLTTTCNGANSCQDTTISDTYINCYGYDACADSTLKASSELRCDGFYACNSAKMSTPNSNSIIYCGGKNSCYSGSLTSSNGASMYFSGWNAGILGTITAKYSRISCTSYRSCRASDITSNVTYCSGEEACLSATIRANSTLISSGANALKNSIVEDTPYIYDIGDYTFNNGEISSSGLSRLDIISRGYYSTSNSSVLCYSGSVCSIRCQGDESCNGMQLYCEDGATCRPVCYACASCPTIYNVSSIDDVLVLTHKDVFLESPLIDLDEQLKQEKDMYIRNMNFMDIIDAKYGRKYTSWMVISSIVIINVFVMMILYKCIKCWMKRKIIKYKNKPQYEYQSI